MKMVKRSLIAIAVLALIATSVHATGLDYNEGGKIKRDSGWPWEYIALDICTIPVYMDVGMYVEVKECSKQEILLTQVPCPDGRKFPCYCGCDDIEIRANFAAWVGVKKGDVPDGSPIKSWETYIVQGGGDEGLYPLAPSVGGAYDKITICVEAWETKIWEAGPNDKLKVADVVVTVKPQ
jgi:hypothetical protein